jgi:hypothetical protein
MSVYQAWTTISQKLGSRQLLTFGVANQFPVCCLFINRSGLLVFDTVEHMVTTVDQGMVALIIVYNPATQALEVLETGLKWYLVYASGVTDTYYSFVNSNAPGYSSYPPAKFNIDSSAQLYWTNPYGVGSIVSFLLPGAFNGLNALVFCQGEQSCPQVPNITLLNYVTLSQLSTAVNTLQDPKTLCCTQDLPTIIGFLLSLPMPLSSNKSNVYPSLQDCQQADALCTCPTLNTCWMYNSSNVPCCIQGNPTNTVFANDKPALVTKDQNACVAAAVNCSTWRFNTVDVPCCVQRTPAQWTSSGYSTSGLQSFETKAECDAAATGCNLQSLLLPPTGALDYYGLIMESRYTSGCEPLRTAGVWGTSLSCSSDPSPTDCYSGNCGINYCAPWIVKGGAPYQFTQQVRCLPLEEQCCTGSAKQVVTNAGLPNVSSSCQ